MGSIMLPHCNHPTPKACRTKLLSNISKGMGSIGSQAATGKVSPDLDVAIPQKRLDDAGPKSISVHSEQCFL
eukprot:1159203-Pelagomonas_calceolata.AAC.17